MEIERDKVQKLLDNFWWLCGMCDELNIYEWEDADQQMQKMKEWVKSEFGRKLKPDKPKGFSEEY